ncbi:MAG: hypothetical protein ACRYFX_24090 [Janthinobacterium lividum]
MPLPFRLDEGIYFEDSGKLLPWGERLTAIESLDEPLVTPTQISWRAKHCFGGQEVAVEVVKNAYYNTQGIVEFVSFNRNGVDPWQVFATYSGLFNQTIGPPTQAKDDGYGLPTHLWTRGEVQIIVGVGERFAEYAIFSIHKGKPFWNLNA